MIDAPALLRPLRITGFALLIAAVALALESAWAQGPSDPPPVFDSSAGEKHFRAVAAFADRQTASLTGVEVSYGIARGRAGNPPLLRARVLDAGGALLLEFNDWHPLWEFGWAGGGTQEGLLVKSSGTGAFVFPFDPDATTLELFDVALDREVVRGDLSGAVRAFCEGNPEDPDCELADLLIEDVSVSSEPPVILVGQPAPIAVRTTVANAGPDDMIQGVLLRSVETTPGLSVTPAADLTDELVLEAGAVTIALEQAYTLKCLQPGAQTATFTSLVEPLRAATVDPNPGNDVKDLEMAVDCTIPVAVNLKPGGTPNPIRLGSGGVVPVAILTTTAGEYGLPVAFDATRIDPATLRFGSRDGVESGSGAPEAHARIHVEDALELDGVTFDGDLDALTHHDLRSSGLGAADRNACVRGRTQDGTGFLGCDEVVVR
jgi:hypothetical protein